MAWYLVMRRARRWRKHPQYALLDRSDRVLEPGTPYQACSVRDGEGVRCQGRGGEGGERELVVVQEGGRAKEQPAAVHLNGLSGRIGSEDRRCHRRAALLRRREQRGSRALVEAHGHFRAGRHDRTGGGERLQLPGHRRADILLRLG